MIMLAINQDITKVNRGIITHAVNTRGVMGSGLALQIKRKFPKAFQSYRRYFGQMRPGMIQVVEVGDGLYVCNLASQDEYGRDGRRYTDYDAMRIGLRKLNAWAAERELPIYDLFSLNIRSATPKYPAQNITLTLPNPTKRASP
jgi:hypothetical protein